MNPSEVLRIVDAIHRDKNIDKEIVFQAIEAALVSAARKNYGEEADIQIQIDRVDGQISGTSDGVPLDPEETVGRIGAQTAKQVIIQKIREAERDALFDEYFEQIGQMVAGVVQRNEGRATTVALGNVEAILPRGEQIPGETHHANERVRATVFDVRKEGSRVKVILSRTRPQLVQRLFEQEIPEIAEDVIEIRAMAREPGYRSKVAVSSADQRVDCVGACVGVRGNRIKNIVDELAGERIDIVRWSDDMQVLIPNALQPAEVDEVILCKMMGRAIVLVREDQLSLAIGRRGQNVRLGSKLCGWDIEIMTQDELQEQIESAVAGFSSIEGVEDELAERLVGEGFLSYDDLSVIEPDDLMEMGQLSAELADKIVEQAEMEAEKAEQAAAAERQRAKEQERIAKATAEAEELERAREAAMESAAPPVEHTVPDDKLVETSESADAGPQQSRKLDPSNVDPSNVDPSDDAAAESPAGSSPDVTSEDTAASPGAAMEKALDAKLNEPAELDAAADREQDVEPRPDTDSSAVESDASGSAPEETAEEDQTVAQPHTSEAKSHPDRG